jgi:hypothetical protein
MDGLSLLELSLDPEGELVDQPFPEASLLGDFRGDLL